MIGRLHHVIVDAADPRRAAEFWSRVLGLPITYDDGDFIVVSADTTTSGVAFQRAPGLRPATWPDPTVPQQIHFDVMVEDVAEAGRYVVSLGARPLGGDDVYADPAGHPFCLVRRPGWAPRIPE